MTSDLRSRLQADLNEARKQRDRARTLVLSTTLSEIKNREIEIDVRGALPEDELLQVVNRAIKQRRDAAEQMRAGGRPELAEKEESEAELLISYLPKQLEESEVREMIRAEIDGGANAIGPLMGKVMPRIRGKFDGKEANRIAREELAR